MKLDRTLYKKIKRMNREEMRQMLETQFSLGFNAGAESSNNADFRIRLSQVLENTKGIGPKLYDRIMETEKGME